MKTIKNNILALLVFFGSLTAFSGCYTVLWTPDSEEPEERVASSSGSTETESAPVEIDRYYQPERYGGYYDFYYNPWWTKVRLPQASKLIKSRESANATTATPASGDNRTPARDLRNTDTDGRVTSGRIYNSGSSSSTGTSGNTSSGGEVRSRDNSGSGSSRQSSSGSSVKEEKKTNTDAAPSSQSSNNSSRDNRTGDSNSLRNSDGNRSTDKGRR